MPEHVTLSLEQLRPSQIKRRPLGPAPSRALMAHVAKWGVLVPILVQHVPGLRYYILIDGRRRLAAAEALQLATVPAVVLSFGAGVVPDEYVEEHAEAATLCTALHALRAPNRAVELEDLELLSETGLDRQEICQQTGLTPAQYERTLGLMALAPSLRQAFEAGALSQNLAQQIARLPAEPQRRLEATLAERGQVTAQDLYEVTRARRAEAVAALPLFAPAALPPDPTPVAADQVDEIAVLARAALDALTADNWPRTAALLRSILAHLHLANQDESSL